MQEVLPVPLGLGTRSEELLLWCALSLYGIHNHVTGLNGEADCLSTGESSCCLIIHHALLRKPDKMFMLHFKYMMGVDVK